MSDSLRPHRRQPTRPHRPWDSPGKNTGVGCHFLLQCMKVKSESEVTQSCRTLSGPMDCSLPGSSIHGIFQVRVLEWVAIAFSYTFLFFFFFFRFSNIFLIHVKQKVIKFLEKLDKYMIIVEDFNTTLSVIVKFLQEFYYFLLHMY